MRRPLIYLFLCLIAPRPQLANLDLYYENSVIGGCGSAPRLPLLCRSGGIADPRQCTACVNSADKDSSPPGWSIATVRSLCDFPECGSRLENAVSERDILVKIITLSSVALLGFATAAMAATPSGGSSLPEMPGSPAVLVAQSSLPNSGEVSEAFHTGSYTYLHVTKDGQDEWLAIPSREVAVGAEIHYGNGAVMKDFHSGSLNRTFEEVLFLGSVEVDGETAAATPDLPPTAALPPGHAPVAPAPADLPSGHVPVPAAPADLPNSGVVSEAINAGDYTYLKVADGAAESWLAIPHRDISVGAHVRYAAGMSMKDFHSSSLDRTFEEVLFLGGVELAED